MQPRRDQVLQGSDDIVGVVDIIGKLRCKLQRVSLDMTNDYLRRTKTQVRNGYGVETKPEYLADVFVMYDRNARARILNEMDAESDSFDGGTQRETADNMALRMKLEAVHQSLMKANR